MIPRIYVDETCPLEGYEKLSVRVLANASDAEWRLWASAHLQTPGCKACAALRARPADVPDEHMVYCEPCAAARESYGRTIVAFFGPTLLEHDVSTPEAALALFDNDAALPSELVIWLQFVPGQVRERRTASLLGNLISSSTTPTN